MERTLKELQKDKRKLKTAAMTNEGLNSAANKECAAEVLKEQNTMEDLWKSFIQDKYLAVRQPAIDVNDFELKPALIRIVQQNQFTGHPTENPNEHLGRFLRIANSIKLNGVSSEVIQLQLFPFSLRANSFPHSVFLNKEGKFQGQWTKTKALSKQRGRNGRALASHLEGRRIKTASPAKDSKLSS